MKKVATLVLLWALSSCSLFQGAEFGWRPLTGTAYITPKHGLVFCWVGPGGKYLTPEQTADEIDKILDEWFPIYEARWGFGLSRDQRRDHLQRITIQLFQGERVRGNSDNPELHTLGIYWPWQFQIDAAMAAPKHTDGGLNIPSEGLQVLRHEWCHVFQGAYHTTPGYYD